MPDQRQLCSGCGRPVEECYVDVDPETWPEAAVDAYQLAKLSTAASCPAGQAKDMYRTTHGPRTGFCLDRVVRHPEYEGPPIPGLQRDVQGMARAKERRAKSEEAKAP